jgi:hypothetical protein
MHKSLLGMALFAGAVAVVGAASQPVAAADLGPGCYDRCGCRGCPPRRRVDWAPPPVFVAPPPVVIYRPPVVIVAPVYGWDDTGWHAGWSEPGWRGDWHHSDWGWRGARWHGGRHRW